ncbi:hypothetical protein [Natronolimnobius baerhuensis]|uniref:CHAT domain-containing protein n=1 Tax=Natronolimnobius baerhuensis TaxID=253108 RepID=A0A202ECC0_9EURY|nr:hypothetical protein [Natronolimnobius baerhuensis]OVE85879.1 hypothetical protein B2G88_03460 [Natronolimnobius baerhuensis]
MTIEFAQTTSPTGLEIYDSIEQRRLHVRTDEHSSVTDVDVDGFCFPVDRACRFRTATLEFNQAYSATLHGPDGQTEATVDVGETVPLEDRPQFIGLSGPIRIYCRIEASATLESGLTSIRLTFDEPATVILGARSTHDRPAGTITTSPNPESVMQAISTLPSALKTTSPERTWPTLRGHPPLIELGETLEIPDSITEPASDIELIIPPTYEAIYQAAPLAFFLGATLRPGEEPALKTPQCTHFLAEEHSLEESVARLLKRCFLLDCLTRTDGLFQYEFHERTVLADELPFDLADTYAAPLPVRLERYLEVPYDLLEPHVPRWPLTAHVDAEPETAEIVPFIVNELGIIRTSSGQHVETAPPVESTPQSQIVRSASSSRTPASEVTELGPSVIVPDVTDEAVEHAWFSDGVPQNASKATLEAYRNQLTRDERTESIEILLVCNDARMLAEHDLLDETYGNRDALPFEIDSAFGVDTDQLASLLADGGYDFLHYIGHATEDGLRCPDGDLDVRTLESVDLGVFFLNACRSYEQGLALTRRGAFGGVSTYADVPNEEAVDAGETMARLLNRGFPLRGALEIAREHSRLGDQYLIVGDGSTDIAQSDGGAPMVIELERDDETYQFGATSYSTKEFKLGTTTASTLEAAEDRHLTPGATPRTTVDSQAVQEYLTWTEFPVLADDALHWNDGIGPGLSL